MSALAAPLSGPVISRRGLLAGGAVVAAVAAVGVQRLVLQPGVSALGQIVRDGRSLLSVGFIDAVADPADPMTVVAGARAVPAARLRPSGAATAWHLDVIGGTPAFEDVLSGRSLHVETLTDNLAGTEPYSFAAWTHRGGEAGVTSAPIRLRASSAPYGVGARVILGDPASADAVTTTTVLAAVNETGIPGLRAGTYLFGIDGGSWDDAAMTPAADDVAGWRQRASLILAVSPA